MTDSGKNEACARMMGWKFVPGTWDKRGPMRPPRWRRGTESMWPGPPSYGSKPTLFGEMIDKLSELTHAWEISSDPVLTYWPIAGPDDDVESVMIFADTPQLCVRDALIAAGGEHD